jgi:hypothetical protein
MCCAGQRQDQNGVLGESLVVDAAMFALPATAPSSELLTTTDGKHMRSDDDLESDADDMKPQKRRRVSQRKLEAGA